MLFFSVETTTMLKRLYCTILFLCCLLQTAEAQVDSSSGIKAPRKISRNYKKLAHYLCDTVAGDARKVNVIYNWITHNIRYDVKAMQQGNLKRPSTKEVLKRRKTLCDGYATLFYDLCNEAGVPAVVVGGYARDWMFDDSDKFYTPRHAWNAVAIGNSWQLVDVTWGAGVVGQFPGWMQRKLSKARKNPVQYSGKLRFKYQYNPEWLTASPAQFRLKHLPYDPLWQLTDSLMPLYLFEAGEASITAFNKVYGRPMLDYSELDRFSQLPEHLKTIEESERAYRYNPRFHVSMAMQHQGNAIDSIATLGKDAPPALRQAVIGQVKQELKSAEQYVALQKKSISSEYTELKKKNKKKNAAAKSHIRSINSNNTQAITRCKAKITASDSKYRTLQSKAGAATAAHKKVKPDLFRAIKTASPEDAPSTSRLLQLEDSVKERAARISSLHTALQQEQQGLDVLIAANGKRLDSLVAYLSLADSALIQETIGRINMQDNYDADIKKWSALYKDTRLQHADSLQKQYFSIYDTVLAHYEKYRKDHNQYLEQYRKNFKDLEQYKRRNSSNTGLLSEYEQQFAAYSQAYEEHRQILARQGGYIKGNKTLFERLVKHYERQEKLAGYMEKSEEHRQKLEEDNLAKKEAFDKKENEYQKKQLEQTAEKAERFINNRQKRKV